jgi:hypothetical protein
MVLLCLLLSLTLSLQTDRPKTADPCLVTAADVSDSRAPTFGEYPVKGGEIVSKPRLDLSSSPTARAFRTQLQRAIAEGPNYSGHYRLVYWGCGTSCVGFTVVNLKTGKVIDASEFGGVSGAFLDADDFLPGMNDSWAFRFRADSSLLVVLGAPNEDYSKMGAYYFVLQGERLVLVYTTQVHKNCDQWPKSH